MIPPPRGPRGIVVVVTGGRGYGNRPRIAQALGELHAARDIRCLWHGGCSGADALCKEWADEAGIATRSIAADWTKYGRAAGPIRNAEILDAAHAALLVAFPGGKGTADMVTKARRGGLPVWEPFAVQGALPEGEQDQ